MKASLSGCVEQSMFISFQLVEVSALPRETVSLGVTPGSQTYQTNKSLWKM